ncbi:MAG: type II secretion system F family protein [Armatimonadetes bacterium]|nr:type II secretion system F family protein [Armatimonadota bacterium]
MLVLIVIFTFGCITLLVIGLTTRSERSIVRERLFAQSRGKTSALDSVETEMAEPFRDRVILPFLRRLANFAVRLTPGGASQAVEEKLVTAGRPWNMGAREFMGLRVLSVLSMTLLGVAGVNLLDASALLRIVLIVILAFCGAAIPDYLLESAIRKRQSAVRKVLADSLDLMAVCVEAGIGLDGAMQNVVEKLKSPFSDEMSRVLEEIKVGKVRGDALKDMAKRIHIQEVSSFVAAICQADQLGVSIVNVIRVQCDTLRNVRSQRAREAAAKLPVKLLFPLIFCIFPAIFVVVIGPGVIDIFRNFFLG